MFGGAHRARVRSLLRPSSASVVVLAHRLQTTLMGKRLFVSVSACPSFLEGCPGFFGSVWMQASSLHGFILALSLEQTGCSIVSLSVDYRSSLLDRTIIGGVSSILCSPASSPQDARLCRLDSSDCCVSGGLGSLGLLSGAWLVEHRLSLRVCLIGRAGRSVFSCFGRVERTSAVVCERADLSSRSDCLSVFAVSRSRFVFLHASGVVDVCVLPKQSQSRYLCVFAPKTVVLDVIASFTRAFRNGPFVLYSSLSAAFGFPGHTNYSSANACLDAFSRSFVSRGSESVSLQWGAWSEIGMATVYSHTVTSVESEGFVAVSSVAGLWLLSSVLFCSTALG